MYLGKSCHPCWLSYLLFQRGQAPLSDLTVTTSSEALLAGKAPTFRLLVWAVDMAGEPVANVTYVVSENFVVRTKRDRVSLQGSQTARVSLVKQQQTWLQRHAKF